MKKFKETVEGVYDTSKEEKLAHDMALISEAGDMCSVPLEKLKSKVLRDRHKKLCVDPQHWSTTNKKSKDSGIQRAAKRAGMSTNKRKGLYNSLEEGPENIIVLIQDITKQMIQALQKGDDRKLNGLYKNLGKVIK